MVEIVIDENGTRTMLKTESYLIVTDIGDESSSKEATVLSTDNTNAVILALSACKAVAGRIGLDLPKLFNIMMSVNTTMVMEESKDELN